MRDGAQPQLTNTNVAKHPIRNCPLQLRRGGRDINKMARSHLGAAGVVLVNNFKRWLINTTPAARNSGFATFFLTAQPPLLI